MRATPKQIWIGTFQIQSQKHWQKHNHHSCTIRQRIRYGTRIRYAYRTAIGFGLPYRYTSIRLPAARLPPYPVWMQLTAWLVSCQDECTVHS